MQLGIDFDGTVTRCNWELISTARLQGIMLVISAMAVMDAVAKYAKHLMAQSNQSMV